MPHNTDRILTTHVGSLIRPPKLIEFWRSIEGRKPYDEAAFEACLTESVAEVVRQQAEAGVDIVSDGEFSKGAQLGLLHFQAAQGHCRARGDARGAERPDGLDVGRPRPRGISGILCRVRHRNRPRQTARQSRRRQRAAQLFGRRSGRARHHESQGRHRQGQRAIGAGRIPARGRAGERAARRQDRALQGRGGLPVRARRCAAPRNTRRSSMPASMCRSTTRSCPTCTSAWCRRWRRRITGTGRSCASTRSTTRSSGIPEERSRYHICWGSWNGPHAFDVPLKDIVDLLLQVRVGHYSLRGRQSAPRPRMERVGDRRSCRPARC